MIRHLILFFILILQTPEVCAQWDTIVYPDSKRVLIKPVAATTQNLPSLYIHARVFYDASLNYVFPKLGAIGLSYSKYLGDNAKTIAADGFLSLYTSRKNTNSSLGIDHTDNTVYFISTDGIERTLQFGLHEGIAKRAYDDGFQFPILKNQTKYNITNFSAIENSVGFGVVFKKGLIVGIGNENTTTGNIDTKEYRYKLFMARFTMDILYYYKFQFSQKVENGPGGDVIAASDFTFKRTGWRASIFAFRRIAGRNYKAMGYYGVNAQITFQHTLYQPFNTSGVRFYALLGMSYAFKYKLINEQIYSSKTPYSKSRNEQRGKL